MQHVSFMLHELRQHVTAVIVTFVHPTRISAVSYCVIATFVYATDYGNDACSSCVDSNSNV